LVPQNSEIAFCKSLLAKVKDQTQQRIEHMPLGGSLN
jgi:hypothetical protein